MKLVKSLLLGTAAGILAVAGASAADLPSRKGPAVEYVRICDTYGAGFFYIPGTETCLRIQGYARGEALWLSSQNNYQPNGVAGPGSPNPLVVGGVVVPGSTFANTVASKALDQTGFRARARASFDARTQTAYGTLRSFARFDWTQDTGSYIQSNQAGLGSTGRANYFSVRYAFVQWAGFTAGSAQSMFDFYADALSYQRTYGSDAQTNLFAYTATFGGGFSATLSVEDRNRRISSGNYGNGATNILPSPFGGVGPLVAGGNAVGIAGPALGAVGYAGYRMPDFVGNLRVDQPWGSAQVSGAIHQVNTIAGNVIGSPTATTTGYAIQAGVKINLPMLAAGDEAYLQGAYANGALDYIGVGQVQSGNLNNSFLGRGNGGILRADADAFAYATNAVGTPFSYALQKEKGFNITGGIKHYWVPNFYQTLYAGYTSVTPGSVARAVNWNQGGLGKANVIVVGTTLNYSPVAGLDFGVDLVYSRLKQDLAGSLLSPASAVPLGVKVNTNLYEARFRVLRSF